MDLIDPITQEPARRDRNLRIFLISGLVLLAGVALGYRINSEFTSRQENPVANFKQEEYSSPAPALTQQEIDDELIGTELVDTMLARGLILSVADEHSNKRTYYSPSGFKVTYPASWVFMPEIKSRAIPYIFSIRNAGGFLAFLEKEHDEKNDIKIEALLFDRTQQIDDLVIPAIVDEWVQKSERYLISSKEIVIDGKKGKLVRSKVSYDDFPTDEEAALAYFIDGDKAVTFVMHVFGKQKPDPADEQTFLDIVQSFSFLKSTSN